MMIHVFIYNICFYFPGSCLPISLFYIYAPSKHSSLASHFPSISLEHSGMIHHGSAFAFLTAMYYFLVVLGGTFYSFQWDMLLLEAGALTSVCCAPWLRIRLRHNSATAAPFHDPVGVWPIRLLLFKLMFMSGVVKIQANCPTWLNLTALEYHFATQCLPGPLAWHAHQLHPLFLRMSVAAMFVIEVPAAFLLLVPLAVVRRFGVVLQLLLQAAIILTGNYTFFNLLTIALCIPCLEGGCPPREENREGGLICAERPARRELVSEFYLGKTAATSQGVFIICIF